ncbi:hypothetical protein LINPERPRIM_LOCUS33337 [Linum perenne]
MKVGQPLTRMALVLAIPVLR